MSHDLAVNLDKRKHPDSHVEGSRPTSIDESINLILPSLRRRHDHNSSALEHFSTSSLDLAKRSLVTNLAALGLRFVFSQADIIVSSALAHYRTTEFYNNLTARIGTDFEISPGIQNFGFTYGVMKLAASFLHTRGVTTDVLAQVLVAFANVMLKLCILLVVVAYNVAVWLGPNTWVWIRMRVDAVPSKLNVSKHKQDDRSHPKRGQERTPGLRDLRSLNAKTWPALCKRLQLQAPYGRRNHVRQLIKGDPTMWLERLSGQSTPSASPPPFQKRSYSPAPRRSSHLAPSTAARPPYGPRTSSLGLEPRANNSVTSLNTLRLPNGSSLKQQIAPPPDVADPLDVLKDLLGKNSEPDVTGQEDRDGAPLNLRTSHLAEEVDFGGLSLHAFAESADPEETKEAHRSAAQTVEEYEIEKDKFEDLHKSILACDDVLKSVQTSLTSFQQDLGAVSAEIESLQSRSTAMNIRLENRKVVEKLLGPAIEEISIAPAVVTTIAEGQIDSTWIRALDELERLSKTIDTKSGGSYKVSATSDVKPLLDDLTNKAIERIRDFFVSQIKALRSPNINAQVIQQQSFLRYKDMYGFLARHHPVLGEEIGQAYINTMRWYYLSNFSRYKQALEKISIFVVDRNDAIGAEPNIYRGNA
ncbi:MAG: hypothetical protein Q9179_005461 [Wetmoreana sp. 5 TL-2023]